MIIHNATIITWETPNRILKNSALRILKDRVVEIDNSSNLVEKYPSEEMIDAKGQIVMPGFICAHTHFYGVFSRGMAIHGEAPADFVEILNKLWWPLDQSLQEEDVCYSTLVCIIDAIKHGTTTVFDHHASPNFITGSLDTIEKAVTKIGIRASLCYEVTDRGGMEKAELGIEENIRMMKKVSQYPAGSLITSMFGLHAGLTVSDETLRKSRERTPSGNGFHIHVAEHQSDEYHSLNKYGKRVVDRLSDFELTGLESIFVHGVHLDAKEMDIIKQSRTWLTHQPRSNMNNAVGMADVESAIRMGIPICIGNDGFSFAMLDEWRACYLGHKLWKHDPRAMPGNQVVKIGAFNNAMLASHFFKDKIGIIEVGSKADLIIVDYQPITEFTEGNLPWHIQFGFRDSMVSTTIVNGQIIMRDRNILGLDENAIMTRANELSREVWKRYEKQF